MDKEEVFPSKGYIAENLNIIFLLLTPGDPMLAFLALFLCLIWEQPLEFEN